MIDILMATYNGEEFIEEQLNSILNQSYSNWRLIISDDCSQDNTISIVKEYKNKYPDKILLFQNDRPSGSAQSNFFNAIKYTSANYVMFSDQDDIWLPNKIKDTFNLVRKMELEDSMETPILVHTDLMIVDKDLKEIKSSMFEMMNMDSKRCALNNLLVQNIVTGCTVMCNRALINFIRKVPNNAVMHDMWIAMVASAFGKIGFIDKTTILYRQHGKNSVGAKNTRSLNYILYKIFHSKEIHNSLVKQYRQAKEFREIFGDKLSESQIELLENYSSFESKGFIDKYKELKKYKMFRNNKIQVLGQIFG